MNLSKDEHLGLCFLHELGSFSTFTLFPLWVIALVISPSHIEIWSLGQGRVRLRNVFDIFKINIEGAKYVGHMDLGYQDHRIHYLVYFFHIYKDLSPEKKLCQSNKYWVEGPQREFHNWKKYLWRMCPARNFSFPTLKSHNEA